ncbi:conserved Plasmodium protein, unknown function [Plasmodium sp. gorilla clade G3]|nr:conserved Plasmodium protein, unknown function [Plasmodium sp. gorilla clade G3]
MLSVNKVTAFLFFYILLIKGYYGRTESKNILNTVKNDVKSGNYQNMMNFPDMDKIKELINQNKVDEARELFNEMQKQFMKEKMEANKNMNNRKPAQKAVDNSNLFSNLISPNDLQEMIKFYMYLQNILNSKNETSEKKMVKSFLRKTIQKMKDNENSEEKKSIDDIIKDTEGHNEMLEKLAGLMKINKEKLKDEQVKNKLNQILIGMLKFIDYTNNSDITNSLMDEIKIEQVQAEDGTIKPKVQVNISNSKTHLDMLQKATNFMGINIDQEELKKLTVNNKWYENFLNNILNSSDEL